MMIKYRLNLLIVLIVTMVWMPGPLLAAFEPSGVSMEGITSGLDPQAVPEGTLDTVITPTTEDTTGYTLSEYVHTWNTSDTPLSNDDLGVPGVGEDRGVPHSDSDPIVIQTDTATTFANSDGLAWYLHIKTVYSKMPDEGTQLSDDTVFGPYTFDNVPPTADIGLDTTVPGQTATTASGSPVTLLVTGQLTDIHRVRVNSSEQFSTADVYDFSDPVTSTLEYAVSGTGSKTVYAWFEDKVGNTSDAVSLTFEIQAGKSMDPAGEMNLEVGATQVFEIQGSGDMETFDWEIVDANTGLVSTAAEFVGAGTDVATVTLKGVKEDEKVKLKAISDVDSAEYESGTISIVKTTPDFNYDVDGNGQYQTLKDGIILLRYIAGLRTDALIADALADDATRTDTQDIIAYLNSGNVIGAFDVDSNGKNQTLKDGIILLRYIAGLRTNALIADALADDATRTDLAELISYMDQFKPEIKK
jgi:hypothetical protein